MDGKPSQGAAPSPPRGASYAALSKGEGAHGLIVEAARRLAASNRRALDIGAGPLNDTRFLLAAGWSVDAVDRDVHAVALAAKLDNPRLTFVQADIREFSLQPNTYSLVAAIHVLPFLPRGDLARIIPSIVGCLSPGGILCCTLFGEHDSWAARSPDRSTFLPRAEAAALFPGLNSIFFSEARYDGVGVKDEPKHWHVFNCMLQR